MSEIEFSDKMNDFGKVKTKKLKKILQLPSKKTLTLLVGVPNSGKSTLARIMLEKDHSNRKVINSDKIRLNILDYENTGKMFDRAKESEVWRVIKEEIRRCVYSDITECIFDATNINTRNRYEFIKMARNANRRIRIIVLLITLEGALRRNSKRKIKVSEDVITGFFRIYETPIKEEYDKIQFFRI